MGRAGPSAHEHAETPVLSPISVDWDDVMDLHWPLSSYQAQHNLRILHSRPDNMPARCQHLPLRHWWDEGTHAVGVKGWREVEKRVGGGLE